MEDVISGRCASTAIGAIATRVVLSVLLWPILMSVCLYLTWRGIEAGHAVLYFNLTYLGFAIVLFALERLLPYERQWTVNDGQMLPDLAHTLLSKGFSQMLVVVGVAVGIAEAAGTKGGNMWPIYWPLPLQILFGLLIAEAGLYTAHRVAHERPLLWRFHAVHHSAPRLWFFNTGRFHLVDTVVSILLGFPLLFLLGAPSEIFIWVTSITAFVGMLTHCNVEMRLGPLNYLVNTPVLHRWHHSRDPNEGNRNYGENLMVFDLLLRTFFCPGRRPSSNIGINDDMPTSFGGQLLAPFVRLGLNKPTTPPTSAGA